MIRSISNVVRDRRALVFLYAVVLSSVSACKRAPSSCGGPPTGDCPPASSSATVGLQATRPSSGTMPPARLNSLSDDFRTNSGESMKLLDAGQSPRRTLRYEWRLDQKEQLSMELRTAGNGTSA